MIKNEIYCAYIIRMQNNHISNELSKKCFDSCVKNNINVEYWNAFDGTSNSIIIPNNLIHESFIKFLRPVNSKMMTTEIACVMSHFSLWCHCIVINQPIIILEHDAFVIKEFKYHKNENSINYLGNRQQWENKSIDNPSCLVNIEGYGYTFMRATHAYSIDPPMARSLVSYLIKEGITKQMDVTLRSDYFNIFQDDIYAYNNSYVSTINAVNIFDEPLRREYEYS